jgi:hypothetical protein
MTMHELTNGDPFETEYWYGQPWIMFLNELAFRKEKNRVEN